MTASNNSLSHTRPTAGKAQSPNKGLKVRTPIVVVPRRLAPSLIARYRGCPRAVAFELTQPKAPFKTTPALMLGNAVHDALRKFFGLRVAERQLAVLEDCLRSAWPRHRQQGLFADRDEEGYWGLQGLALLRTFWQRFDTQAVPLLRERWLSMRLKNGVELYSKIDRIDGARRPSSEPLRIIDYKTGRYTPDPEDLVHEPAAQAQVVLAQAHYKRPVEAFSELHLAGEGAEIRWCTEAEDIAKATELLLAVTTQMISDKVFEARPSEQLCARCPWADICPDAGRVELDEIVVPEHFPF